MEEFEIDPHRVRGFPKTEIYVRAKNPEGQSQLADISILKKESLLKWLRSRGGCNHLAENTVGSILGYGHLEEEREIPITFLVGQVYKLVEDLWIIEVDDSNPVLEAGRYQYLRNHATQSSDSVHSFLCLKDKKEYYLEDKDIESAKFELEATLGNIKIGESQSVADFSKYLTSTINPINAVSKVLTKKEQFAIAILQGILASGALNYNEAVKDAVRLADQLLKELR